MMAPRGLDAGGTRGSVRAPSVSQRLAQQEVVSNLTGSLLTVGTVSMREAIEDLAANATGEMAEVYTLFAQSLRNNTRRLRDRRLTRVNQIAGEAAQATMLRRYDASRKTKGAGKDVRGGVGRNKRYSNGALKRALASPAMFEARWDGVAFVNRALLDKEAKQWARLNFGAAGANVSQGNAFYRRRAEVEFFNALVLTASFAPFNNPRPGFKMPKGAWRVRGGAQNQLTGPIEYKNFRLYGANDKSRVGRDEYLNYSDFGVEIEGYLDSKTPADAQAGFKPALGLAGSGYAKGSEADTRFTKGITPTYFLDTGLRALARNLGDGWTKILQEWLQEATTAARLGVQSSDPISLRAGIDGTNPDIQGMLKTVNAQTNLLGSRLNKFR